MVTRRSAASISYSCTLLTSRSIAARTRYSTSSTSASRSAIAVRLREVESDSASATADLARSALRAGLVPSRHDDVVAVVGVGLRELAAESLRAADDDDAAHSLSFRAVRSRRPDETQPDRRISI